MSRPERRFLAALGCLVLLAATVRIWFALVVVADVAPTGDAQYFRDVGQSLSEGQGFTLTPPGTTDHLATAQHPPLFSVVIGMIDRLGLSGVANQRIAVCLLASTAVFVIGLVGRRLWNPRAGLLAAGIAAIHPLWFQSAAILMSESIYLVLLSAVLLLALRMVDHPSLGRATLLGATTALAVLTRTEAVLLLPLLAVIMGLRAERLADAARWIGVAALAVFIVLSPWLIRNQARFGDPVLSNNDGITLAGANCDETYYGDRLGSFALTCAFSASFVVSQQQPASNYSKDEHQGVKYLRANALHYASENRGRLPTVAAARIARTWGVMAPSDQLDVDTSEGRDRGWQRAGNILQWFLLPAAIVGFALLVRGVQRDRWLVLAAPLLLVTVTSVAVYGSTRIRTAAEPVIAVLAAIVVDSLWTWFRRRSQVQVRGVSMPELERDESHPVATQMADCLAVGHPKPVWSRSPRYLRWYRYAYGPRLS